MKLPKVLVFLLLLLPPASAMAAVDIPNINDATFPSQAEIDSKDFQIISSGINHNGVISGCAITAQPSPNMTVAVSACVITIAGTQTSISGQNATIGTAPALNPRFDLVSASASGIAVTEGTPLASPVFPTIPASSTVLAAVYVPAGVTSILSTYIVDKRTTLADLTYRTIAQTVTALHTFSAGLSVTGGVVEIGSSPPGIANLFESDDPGPTWAGLATPYSANRFIINDFPVAAQFGGGAPVVETLTSGVDVPASADYATHGAGLAGYARTSSTSVGGVGTFGSGSTHVAGSTAWGSNFVVANEGLAAASLFGIEVDINHTNSTSAAVNVSGVSVTGASDSQASGVFAAFIANPAGIFESPMIKWKNAYISQPGAATSGLALFTQDATGASASQYIEIYGRDAGDAYHGAIIQALSTGELDIRAADAGGIKITSNVAANWMTFTSAGQVQIEALKTTGSAATKKVVCVDVTTGQIYASTSDTACAS